jgi:hypothetical protein
LPQGESYVQANHVTRSVDRSNSELVPDDRENSLSCGDRSGVDHADNEGILPVLPLSNVFGPDSLGRILLLDYRKRGAASSSSLLWIFHQLLMGLSFESHEVLLWIFFVNVPYWIAKGASMILKRLQDVQHVVFE